MQGANILASRAKAPEVDHAELSHPSNIARSAGSLGDTFKNCLINQSQPGKGDRREEKVATAKYLEKQPRPVSLETRIRTVNRQLSAGKMNHSSLTSKGDLTREKMALRSDQDTQNDTQAISELPVSANEMRVGITSENNENGQAQAPILNTPETVADVQAGTINPLGSASGEDRAIGILTGDAGDINLRGDFAALSLQTNSGHQINPSNTDDLGNENLRTCLNPVTTTEVPAGQTLTGGKDTLLPNLEAAKAPSTLDNQAGIGLIMTTAELEATLSATKAYGDVNLETSAMQAQRATNASALASDQVDGELPLNLQLSEQQGTNYGLSSGEFVESQSEEINAQADSSLLVKESLTTDQLVQHNTVGAGGSAEKASEADSATNASLLTMALLQANKDASKSGKQAKPTGVNVAGSSDSPQGDTKAVAQVEGGDKAVVETAMPVINTAKAVKTALADKLVAVPVNAKDDANPEKPPVTTGELKKLMEFESNRLQAVRLSNQSMMPQDAEPSTKSAESPNAGSLLPGLDTSLPANLSRASASSEMTNKMPTDYKALIDQVVQKAELMVKLNSSEIKIHLQPEFMGKMTIKIAVEDGLLTARFITDNNQVKHLLDSNLGALRQSLESHGIKVERTEVNVQLNNGSSYDGYQEGRQDMWQRPSAANYQGRHNPEGDAVLLPESEEMAYAVTNDAGYSGYVRDGSMNFVV